MALKNFYVKQIVVRREREVGNNRRALQATATVDGYFRSNQGVFGTKQGIVADQAWRFYFDIDEDIKEGDVLHDVDSGKNFTVREVIKKDFGINQHLEVNAFATNA